MSSDITPQPVKQPAPTWLQAIIRYVLIALFGLGSSVATYFATAKAPDPPPIPPEISIAAEFYTDVGELVELPTTTTGTRVRWRSCDKGLQLIDGLPDLITRKSALAVACKPGVYRVECWTAINGEPSKIYRASVTVGQPTPPPNPPLPPDPGPLPPAPPTPPVPPTPGPTSELGKKLQVCWTADATALVVKNSQKSLIIGLYEAMADHAKNTAITTTGELLGDLKTQAAAMLLPSALTECRKIISAEIATALGTDPAAKLDPVLRPKAIDVFTRVAKAVQEVK